MARFVPFALSIAFAASPGLAAADPPNLLVNGSFEANVVAAGVFHVYGPSQVPGWTLTTALELRHDANGTAKDGVNFAELDAFANNSISQVVDTVVGSSYELSFWYSNRINTPVASNGLSFDIGTGAVVVPALPLNTTNDNVWTHYTDSFVATSSHTTLTFAALGTSDTFGTSLDDVSITGAVAAVPEPETLALMLVGLGGLAGWRRRSARFKRFG